MNGWLILGVIILVVAGTVAYRLNPKNPIDGTIRVSGFVITFLLIFGLMGIPAAWLVRESPGYMQESWGWAVGEEGVDLTDLLPGAGADRSALVIVATPTPDNVQAAAVPTTGATQSPVQQHTVKAGETLVAIAKTYGLTVEAIVTANSIPYPDRIAVGQILIIPPAGGSDEAHGGGAPAVVANVTPTLTPAPIVQTTPAAQTPPVEIVNFSFFFAEIERAKRDGDLETGQEWVNYILEREPENSEATAYQQEINAATELRRIWQSFGEKKDGRFIYGWNDVVTLDGRDVKAQTYVARMMFGHSFQIVEIKSKMLAGYFAEAVLLRCTSEGWMKGAEFSVQRFMIRQISSKDDEGYTFYVGQ